MVFASERAGTGVTIAEAAAPPSSAGKRTLVQLLEAQLTSTEAVAPPAEVAHQGLRGPAQRLPHLEKIQALFGRHDVGHVQAHVGGPAAEATNAMGAEAYATGSAVAFGDEPDLHTAAHEAAHVVQQQGGVQLAGGVGRAGDAHEQHADAVADLVVQGKSAEGLLDRYAGSGGAPGVQHRVIASAVYAAFDAGAARQVTRDLIAAGNREEEIAAAVVEATALNQQMIALAGDPLVAAQAGTQAATVAGHLATAQNQQPLITLIVNDLETKYSAELKPAALAACRPKGRKAAQLRAALDARVALEDRISAAIAVRLGQSVAVTGRATQAVAAMRAIVDPLQATRDRLAAARRAYRRNIAARDASERDDVAGRAGPLGVAVPTTAPTFLVADGHAALGQWDQAAAQSSAARGQLDTMRHQVERAEADKLVYTGAVDELAELRRMKDRFTDLTIESTQLDAAIVEADAARDAYQAGQWSNAAAATRRATSPLAALRALIIDFEAYRTDDKLLTGTINKVHRALAPGPHLNQRALQSLEATYKAQCEVSREDWLVHLGIAGRNTVGPDRCHYTKFNDAIDAFATLSVETATVRELCAALFEAVPSLGQLHATRVVGGTRYHKYWDGTYSANVATDDLAVTDPVAHAELDAKHTEMQRVMTEKVTSATAAHGRVGRNELGRRNRIITF
jgi:hypothetical protein